MVSLTENAVKKFKEVLEQEKRPEEGIRLYMVPGGWSPSLAMDIVKSGLEGDATVEQDSLKLFLDPMAKGMLTNTMIDFNETQGFVLSGMQPQGSSCGTCKC